MTRLGLPELAVIAMLILVLFGPSMIRRFGQSVKEMRKLARGEDDGPEQA